MDARSLVIPPLRGGSRSHHPRAAPLCRHSVHTCPLRHSFLPLAREDRAIQFPASSLPDAIRFRVLRDYGRRMPRSHCDSQYPRGHSRSACGRPIGRHLSDSVHQTIGPLQYEGGSSCSCAQLCGGRTDRAPPSRLSVICDLRSPNEAYEPLCCREGVATHPIPSYAGPTSHSNPPIAFEKLLDCQRVWLIGCGPRPGGA